MNEIGRNIAFPIHNEDGSVFHGLVLHQATYESVVMSLGDKITGDVYYKDNTLKTTGLEYIEYRDELRSDAVKYVLVSPPTVVKEGMVSDNSDLKGMTKYSFTFYHPMYILNNISFSDVAVEDSDARFRSENKKFSWIGNMFDFVDKLNKNLENTVWHVVISERVPIEISAKLSEVLSFDNNSIGEALQKAYETWEAPFIISTIRVDEPFYGAGKRFSILFGLPSNEIYASDADKQIGKPFVFKYGKGLGLKNNSATPKNNKIVTRIVGYGSETNIPYGYPQIIWYGNQEWDYTINNDKTNIYSYPIYDGVVGGRKVRLIKHPYTRNHLMPSVYHLTVFNRVSPYLSNGQTNPDYNPNTQLIDYYDATDSSVFPNVISPNAPSLDTHEFDIKPELGDEAILSATPINNQAEAESEWNDDIDNDGNYVQSYFKVKLPVLSFDLYATASLTEEMQINMRSGACIGCTFGVQVDWDEYRANMYDADGNFQPYGEQRDYEKYPRSDQKEIEIILQKDTNTFGILMPNVYQYPKSGDKFVILGISLPETYITSAESRLDDEMKSYMLTNNVHYFDYPLKFDEKFLLDNANILSQIRNNTIIRFEYAGIETQLYVKQISIKWGQSPLPQYNITLTDDVDVVLNQIGQTQKDIGRINTLIASLRESYGKNVWNELANKLSKTSSDTARGHITFNSGITNESDFINKGYITNGGTLNQEGDVVIGLQTSGHSGDMNPIVKSDQYDEGVIGWQIDHVGNMEVESLTVRSLLRVTELLINRLQAQEGDTMFSDNDQITAVSYDSASNTYILDLKEKWEGYFTAQKKDNIIKGIINTLAAKQAGISDYSDTDTDKQGKDDGGNLYYTSWMKIEGVGTDDGLHADQIRVSLWPESHIEGGRIVLDVPSGKNFPPCVNMTIARWGCVDYEYTKEQLDDMLDNETITAEQYAEGLRKIASVEQRQRLFMVSTSDGRIVKMRRVNKPILEEWNYGTTLGTIPDFMWQWTEVAEKALPNRDYLYAQGIIYQSLIHVNPQGEPFMETVDCGIWADGTDMEHPSPGNGIYLAGEWNEDSGQWEKHDVWWLGCKWRALVHQPVTSGGVTAYYPPKWNSPYWRLVEGNGNLSVELVSSNGSSFRKGYVSTVVTPVLFYGSTDITSDVTDTYWSWTRRTENSDGYTDSDIAWNNNHEHVRVLSLTDADMPQAWSRANRAVFTVTAVVNDGKNETIVQNQVIA